MRHQWRDYYKSQKTRGLRAWSSLVSRGPVVVVALGILILILVAYHATQVRERQRPERVTERLETLRAQLAPPPDFTSKWKPPPEFVKGIYVSAAAAGTTKMFARLVDLVDRTEINSMVIDVKDGNGALAFIPTDPTLADHVAKHPSIPDLKAFTAPLREKGIYLIARLFVFQDPAYVALHPEVAVKSKATGGIWRDRKGIPWVDPGHKEAWDYAVKIAREAYAGGFDEVQFDYIRFPSDGAMSDIRYPVFDATKTTKAQNMEAFFKYISDELHGSGVKLSVDLFGLVMWQHVYDLNIGQRLDIAAKHFDFISPMVYPSHYPRGFEGFPNPADFPYEIVHDNLLRGQPLMARLHSENPGVKIATIRPWLQDFDLGADYDAAKVKAQMKAAVDGGASGWILWNARNVYTEEALQAETAN